MNPETEALIKSIAELKTAIVLNNEPKAPSLLIALWGSIGALVGSIITVLMNLFKEKFMFKQNKSKEERIRKQESAIRDDDLIRKLISRVLGLNFSIMHTVKAYNLNAVSGGYYCRLVELSNDKDSKLLTLELMREQNNQAELNLSKFIANIRELSEIVGEYMYLIPESKLGGLYAKFIKTEFHISYDFKAFNTEAEASDYRIKIITEHAKKLELIANTVFEMIAKIEEEGHQKFKESYE
jgi:hypothetical protein